MVARRQEIDWDDVNAWAHNEGVDGAVKTGHKTETVSKPFFVLFWGISCTTVLSRLPLDVIEKVIVEKGAAGSVDSI